MRQEIHWVDETRNVEVAGIPDRVWYVRGNWDRRPALPMVPRDIYNAVSLDKGHDWRMFGNVLRYSGFVGGPHSCWLLLEYDDV